MQIAASDGYDNTKPGALESTFRRIDSRRLGCACINHCDPQLQKRSVCGEISVGPLERPRAGSRNFATRMSGLSFRKYHLAVVRAYTADFPANSHRCTEGPCIHGSIEVERVYRGGTAGLQGGHRISYPKSSYAAAKICVDAQRRPAVQRRDRVSKGMGAQQTQNQPKHCGISNTGESRRSLVGLRKRYLGTVCSENQVRKEIMECIHRER